MAAPRRGSFRRQCHRAQHEVQEAEDLLRSAENELEDLAFKFLEPEAYEDLQKRVRASRREREKLIFRTYDVMNVNR